nr:MAG TPA: hypothetical protein [Caudoviricetes sp.]
MKIQNINVNLSEFQDGELQKNFEKELKKVIESFLEENSDLRLARKIQINLQFNIYEEKGMLVQSDIKTTIPKKSIRPTLIAAIKNVPGNYSFIETNSKRRISGQVSFEEIMEENNKGNIVHMYDEIAED